MAIGRFSEEHIILMAFRERQKKKRIGDTLKGSTHFEAEDFDWGGDSITYYDTTPANSTGKYRPDEPVDIEDCTDEGGGYNITVQQRVNAGIYHMGSECRLF
jgi:hypothetical protein